MKIESVSIKEYFLPFTSPLKILGKEMIGRRGYILTLVDSNGNKGLGEVSPLPNLSKETLNDCMGELRTLKQEILDTGVSFRKWNISKPFFHVYRTSNQYCPSVSWGIESALLGLLLRQNSFAQIFPTITTDEIRVPVNGLLIPSASENLLVQYQNICKANFRFLKVKIGITQFETEIESIKYIHKKLGNTITFRLDANRGLTKEKLQEYCTHLADIPIEYIEEPFPNGNFEQHDFCSWPYAIDETLSEIFLIDDWEKHIPKGMQYFILKPSIIGGISKLIQVINRLKTFHAKCVLSSCFNTSISIAIMTLLGNIYAPDVAHGLDTLKYFQKDIFRVPIFLGNGEQRVDIDYFTSSAS